MAVVDGKIYVIGGYDEEPEYDEGLDSVEVYDPQADSWQQVASMPGVRYSHAATSMGGKIYVTGGYENGAYTSTLILFDPLANTWTELAGMGSARVDHACAGIGGKLHVFGGYGADGHMASVEAYDPISNTWAQVSDLTSARDDLVAVAL